MTRPLPLLPRWRPLPPLSRDKANTLLLLFTCLLVLAPHAAHLPALVSLSCAVILAWRAWITLSGSRLPPRLLLLPISLLAAAIVFSHYHTVLGRDAGVAMLVLLLTLKLLEMHARRDLYVVLFLSFFLVLAQYFHSQSIGTAVITLLAITAILTTQLTYQYGASVPSLLVRLRHAGLILGLALPLTVVLFVLFPRLQGPLWNLPGDAHSARSGLSDSMTPGKISKLAMSDEIAFRAHFYDPPPGKPQLYWRGPVLGDYDGRTWRALRVAQVPGKSVAVHARGGPLRYQVTMEPTGQRWLYALELPRIVPELPGNATGVTPELELATALPIQERVRYEAVSFLDFSLQPNEAPEVLQQWLALPSGFNPRTIAFAQEMQKQVPDPEQQVDSVLRFFHREKFRYTLQPPVLGKHVADEFLFETRAGFCEHYSSAFVILMRAMGVPARVVTGYQGGEINPTDGYMVVRQSDAHAWTEVWLRGRGWVRVDPTSAVAPERVEKNLASAVPRPYLAGLINLDGGSPLLAGLQTMRHRLEALANAWNQRVLNYGAESQKNLMGSFGFDANWQTLVRLMAVVACAVLLGMAFLLIRSGQRRDPVEETYHRFCQRMARRGCPRLPCEGPRDYCDRLCNEQSPLSDSEKCGVRRFLQTYEAVRYGATARGTNLRAASELKSLLAQCR